MFHRAALEIVQLEYAWNAPWTVRYTDVLSRQHYDFIPFEVLWTRSRYIDCAVAHAEAMHKVIGDESESKLRYKVSMTLSIVWRETIEPARCRMKSSLCAIWRRIYHNFYAINRRALGKTQANISTYVYCFLRYYGARIYHKSSPFHWGHVAKFSCLGLMMDTSVSQ